MNISYPMDTKAWQLAREPTRRINRRNKKGECAAIPGCTTNYLEEYRPHKEILTAEPLNP